MANDLYDDTLDQVTSDAAPTLAPAQPPAVRPANPYDAVVTASAAPVSPPPARPVNPYDAVVANRTATAQQPLRAAVQQAADTTPDRAAQVQKLSDQTGIAPDFIDRNFEAIQKRAQFVDTPYSAMLKDSPATATFLSAPAQAAVSADDHGPLGALEYLLTLPYNALRQSYYENQAGALSAQRFFGPLTQEDADKLNVAQYYAGEGSRLTTGDSWYGSFLTKSMKFLAGLVQPAALPAIIGTGVGATFGGLAGVPGGPVGVGAGIVSGGEFGAGIGATTGLAQSAFLTAAGNALERNLKATDAFGQRIDTDVAKYAALGEGVLNAALMVGGGKIVGPAVEAAAGKMGALFTRDAVAKALQQPSVISALGELAKRTALGTTELSLFGAGQQAATILSSAIVSAAGGAGPATPPVPTAAEAAEQLGTAAAQSAEAGVLTMAAFPAIGLAADMRRAQLAQFTPAFVDALGEGAAQSKTAQRAPQAFQDFITGASKDGPVPAVYVPLDAWNAHWQAKGVDPAKMAATVTGDAQAYDLAAKQGGDLTIPTGRYASLLSATDANQVFRDEIRLAPDAMNGRESAAFAETLKTLALPEAETPSAAETAVAVQLAQAGQPRELADAGGRLFTAITSLADRAGIAPEEIFDPSKLSIMGEAPALATTTAPAEAAVLPEQTATATVITPGEPAAEPEAPAVDPAVLARLSDSEPVGQEPAAGIAARATADEPIAAMSDLNAAVTQMRAENARIVQEAAALRDRAATIVRAEKTRPPREGSVESEADHAVAATSRSGEEPPSAEGERAGPDQSRVHEGASDGPGAERGGVQAGPDVFVRQTVEQTAARLTPPVKAELAHLLDELQTFPFTERTWSWLRDTEKKTGNAAGGDANVVPGSAGTPLYDDVLYLSPVNKKANGEPAKDVHGSRGQVIAAIEKLLATGDAHNNLAEGALRLAERHAAGDWKDLNPSWLPKLNATVAPPELIHQLSDDIDEGLGDESEGDASFDVAAFDTLETGEQQARLPGDVGEVRNEERPTPQEDAPFSLTSERPSPLGNAFVKTLFQTRDAAPVATLTGTELGDGLDDLKDLRAAAVDYYARELQHGQRSVERPGFGTVTFTRSGRDKFKHTSANADKLRLVPAIPDVIVHGEYHGRTPAEAPRADGLVAFHFFTGDVQLGERRLVVGVTVGEDAAGNKFYNLNPDPEALQAQKKARRGSQSQTGAVEPSKGGGSTTLDQSIEPSPGDVNLTLGQDDTATRRGSYTPGAAGEHVIRLLAHADVSTAVHEFGHLFHNVFADVVARLDARDPATLTESQKQVLRDYGALREWLGAEPRGDLTVAQHEQMANGFVAYLREGKAPSVALQSTFARFRAWLTRVYASMSPFGFQLTPEVRGVFDRLLVSDQAIHEAEEQRGVSPLFATAADAGMSDAEFENYRQTVQTAHDTAQRELDRKMMRDVAREQSKTYRDQRDALHAQVTTELREQPVYRAIAAITKGTHPDGTPLIGVDQTPEPLKLSRAIVEGRYGADVRKALPRGLTTTDGGLDPDAAAELFGFASGDALVKAIAAAPKLRDAIESTTTARMIQQHGGLLVDGTLDAAAQVAVANTDHDAVVRAEMRALGRKQREVQPFVQQARDVGDAALEHAQAERAYERRWLEAETKLRIAIAEGHKQVEIDQLTQQVRDLKAQARGGAAVIRGAIPPEAVLKANARERLASTPVSAIRPDAFWSAARRAALQATERAARQDFAGAITAKQQELINLHLFREGQAALDDVQTRVERAARLDRPGARATVGKVGGGFLDQIDGVLDRFGFSKADPHVLDRKASIDTWQKAKQADGVPLDLPATVLNGEFRKPYKDLTLDQFKDVTDALTQIDHVARAEGRTFRSAAADAFATERDGLVASIREHNETRALPVEFGRGENRKLSIGNYFASMTKLSILARGLDGSEDGGPMWESFIRRANEAADAENAMNTETGARLNAVLDAHYPGAERRTLSTRTDVAGVGSLSKEARLAVALNSGTETGRDRLLSDPARRWTATQHQAVLDTLDRRDWQFVQDTWTEINRFRDAIGAKQLRVTGVEPVWVDGIPIQTKFGEMQGAYYPLKYDGRLAPRAVQLDLMNEAKLQMGAAYVATTTQRGFTETRQAHVGLPVRLDLGVGYQHLGQVIHDLTHHEMLIDVTRLLRDRQVSEAIYQTKGSNVYKQFTGAFQNIATGLAPPTDVLQRSANFLRSGLQIANMGLSLSIAAKHPLGIFNGAALIGPEWMAKGVARWAGDAAHIENTLDWIKSNSPMMRDRVHTETTDLSDLSAGLNQAGGWFDTAVRALTDDHLTQQTIRDGLVWHIGLAQRAADVPTWLGGYEKAMDAQRRAGGDVDETRAFRLADQAVLDSQGGGNLIDRAAVQRGNAYARLFMTFYSYGARLFNSTVEASQRTNFKSPASVIKYLGNLSLLYVMPALANEAIRQASGTVKAGEDATATFLTDVGKDMLGSALNSLVGVREVGAEIANFVTDDRVRDYTGPAGVQYFTSITRALQQSQRALKQGEVDEPLARSLNDVLGPLVPYPSSQIDKTVAGWEALRDGRTDNPAALVYGAPQEAK